MARRGITRERLVTRNRSSAHIESFERRTLIDAPAEQVFAWHIRPGAIERLVSPWEQVRIVHQPDGIADGDRVVLEVDVGPRRRRWVARLRDVRDASCFTDVQEEGPFASWVHRHSMRPDGLARSRLEDRIEYRLPFGLVSPSPKYLASKSRRRLRS